VFPVLHTHHFGLIEHHHFQRRQKVKVSEFDGVGLRAGHHSQSDGRANEQIGAVKRRKQLHPSVAESDAQTEAVVVIALHTRKKVGRL
jgi:hypothetical protein